jgi:pyrroline-5-carboxylate reductase
MQDLNISFIGGGNMAEALISGLIRAGHRPDHLTVSDVKEDRLAHLREAYHVTTRTDNDQTAAMADMVVLAVKPQAMQEVCKSLKGRFSPSATVISIAAGLGTERLHHWLGLDVNLVRVMPNTPCLVGAGMSVLYAEPSVSAEHRRRAEYVLSAAGEIAWVENEDLLHAVTAVSGSGPAYYFLLSEIIEAAGVSLGLPEELASRLVQQTAYGAGRMLVESGRRAADLRRQVTSPGGTTQEALDMMYDRGLPDIIRAAIQAAEKRSKSLA